MTVAVVMVASSALTLSVQAVAQPRKSACTSTARATAHGAGACSKEPSHKSKTHGSSKSKAHGHPKAKAHHPSKKAKKAKKLKKTKHRTPRKATRKAKHEAVTPVQTKAACEDGSIAVHVGSNSFVCDDGSQPECEGGSFPIESKNGATLLCNQPAKGTPAKGGTTGNTGSGSAPKLGEEEAICEDGTSPYPERGGSFACDDGSEPYCEEGLYPTVSNDGATLQCSAEEAEE